MSRQEYRGPQCGHIVEERLMDVTASAMGKQKAFSFLQLPNLFTHNPGW